MKRKNTKKFIILLICLIILIGAFAALTIMHKAYAVMDEFGASSGSVMYGLYQEPSDSLDGVYVGSSSVYRYWMPTEAFEQEGFCIYGLGTAKQPILSIKYLIDEAVQNQSNLKVVIVDIRAIARPTDKTPDECFKIMTDTMPLFSSNRSSLIKDYLAWNKEYDTDIDYSSSNYYIPFLRDNMSWLTDFSLSDLKGLTDESYLVPYKGYVFNDECVAQAKPSEFTEVKPLDDTAEETLNDLLDYCSTLDAEVIFVSSPFRNIKRGTGEITYALKKCSEAGFTTLDFNCEPLQSEIAMDWENEFYNKNHVNYKGALHYTEFLTNYLSEHYYFEDHRDDSTYDSWHETHLRLMDRISESELDN